MLKITNLQVFPIREPKGKLRAYARVLLEDQIQLTGLRVYEGAKEYFVSYPNDPGHKGEGYRQLFYPVTRELREHIEKSVLQEYMRGVMPGLFTGDPVDALRDGLGDYGKLTNVARDMLADQLA